MSTQATLTPEQLVFVLTQVDNGPKRTRLLGITERHYTDISVAKEWATNLLSILKAIPWNNPEKVKAINEVNLIWMKMSTANIPIGLKMETYKQNVFKNYLGSELPGVVADYRNLLEYEPTGWGKHIQLSKDAVNPDVLLQTKPDHYLAFQVFYLGHCYTCEISTDICGLPDPLPIDLVNAKNDLSIQLAKLRVSKYALKEIFKILGWDLKDITFKVYALTLNPMEKSISTNINASEFLVDVFPTSYFRDPRLEVVYALTELEGEQQNRALGLLDIHYEDKNAADAWILGHSNTLHSLENTNIIPEETLQKAFGVLREIGANLFDWEEESDIVLNGVSYTRIPYGSENEDWGASSGKRCFDCGVNPGELHKSGCDIERCPACGGQLISCGCYDAEDLEEEDPAFQEVPIQFSTSVLDYAKHLGWTEAPQVIQVVGENPNWRLAVLKRILLEVYQPFNIEMDYGVWIGEASKEDKIYQLEPNHSFKGVGPFLHHNNCQMPTWMCRVRSIESALFLIRKILKPGYNHYPSIILIAETVNNPEDLTRLINTFCPQGTILAFGTDSLLPCSGLTIGAF